MGELLKMHILPGLNKLHEEQTAYCRWKEVNHDIECLKRVIIVLKLKNQENFLNHIEKEIKLGKNQIEKINLFKKKLIATMNKNIINREKIEKNKEKNKFREYKEIMVKITTLFKKIIKDLSHLNHVLIRLKLEQINHFSIQLSINELDNVLINTNKENLIKERNIFEHKLNETYKLLEGYGYKNAKINARNNFESSREEIKKQLIQCRINEKAIQNDKEKAEIRKKLIEKELDEEKRLYFKEKNKENKIKEKIEIEKMIKSKMEYNILTTRYNKQKLENLMKERKEIDEKILIFRNKIEHLGSTLQKIDFKYKKSQYNFTTNNIKGVVAKLIRVKDLRNNIALEVIAGAKLYNMVIDSEETAKQLLTKGLLLQRVTMIPLNKIKKRICSKEKIRLVEKNHQN